MDAFFLVNEDLVFHELEISGGVTFRLNRRDLSTLFVNEELKFIFQDLIKVVVLQVVDDPHVVDVATTGAQEGVAGLVELALDHYSIVSYDVVNAYMQG